MAIAERIVVVDDDDPAGRPDEIFDVGHRRRPRDGRSPGRGVRLHAHDPDRLAILAQRCAPSICVLLDAGDRLELRAGRPPGSVRWA